MTRKSIECPRSALVVLGMHRSGTSAFTRLMGLMGATLPKEHLQPDPCNPLGFWESSDVVEANECLLREAGATWSSLGLQVPELSKGVRSKMAASLRRAFGKSSLWVLKDPRMCRLVPVWEETLRAAKRDVRFVLVGREPREVAESLLVRDALPREVSQMLWLEHMLEAEYYTRHAKRVFVSYDALLRNWRQEIRRITTVLNLPWADSIESAASEIDAYLSPVHRHHWLDECEHTIQPCVQAGWETLQDAYRDDCAAVWAAFDTHRAAYWKWCTAGGPVVQAQTKDAFALRQVIEGLRQALTRVERSCAEEVQEAQRLVEDARAETKRLYRREELWSGVTAQLAVAAAAAHQHAQDARREPDWIRAWKEITEDKTLDCLSPAAAQAIAAIAASGKFSVPHYLSQNPDVAAEGQSPIVHYVLWGASEGRNPHPAFDTRYYESSNPEVNALHVNPFHHYLSVGESKKRRPHPNHASLDSSEN